MMVNEQGSVRRAVVSKRCGSAELHVALRCDINPTSLNYCIFSGLAVKDRTPHS